MVHTFQIHDFKLIYYCFLTYPIIFQIVALFRLYDHNRVAFIFSAMHSTKPLIPYFVTWSFSWCLTSKVKY